MIWIARFFNWLFKGNKMALEHCRDEDGKLRAEDISEGYVLYDYNNHPIGIFVCAKGVWMTIIPYDATLDNELAALLKDKFGTRHLEWLIKIQDDFAADLEDRKEILKKSKNISY